MKRALLPFLAAGLLLVTACGDATTEKVSHGTTTPDADDRPATTSGTPTGMADTMSTNATPPASASPSGGTGD